jgi:hypothetical protein
MDVTVDRIDIRTLLGDSYCSHQLSGDITKLYNMDFEVFLRRKSIMFIVDKRNTMLKKIYRDIKYGYETIVH